MTVSANLPGARPGWTLRAPDANWVLVLPILALIALLYLVPLANVLLLSVTEPRPGLDNFERVLTARGPLRVLGTTLEISAITTLISVVLGYLVALAITHTSAFQNRLIMLGVLVSMWISVLIRAFSWLMLLRDTGPVNEWLISTGLISAPIGFVRTELGVIISMVHYLLPFAILSVMRGIDERVIFAARSLGAGATRTFLKVYLPLTFPGVFAATIIVFVFALGFYVTPAIVGGGRVVMIAESVSVSILTTARWGYGAAQATVLLVLAVGLIVMLERTVGFRQASKR